MHKIPVEQISVNIYISWMCYHTSRTLKVFAFVRGHEDFELCDLFLFKAFLV